MASKNEVKSKTSTIVVSALSDAIEPKVAKNAENVAQTVENSLDSDDILNSLKTLLITIEKLQKVRLEAGDIKPLIEQMLDGEPVRGEEIEKAKIGANALNRLVRAYSDHQAALLKAQSARTLLDQVLSFNSAN
ncbi:hypothetical protein FD723_35835 (plasmid) [Nostoc sp. C052]|uniref:hypothetical protein n=1 Tax=Nostoc sp. C052 TaxID=2576902 RepID=UPI0015C37AE8|nr:hypothetical protein [Nostoc sp. C052]QLE45633.1 hypothetical protein FD723_35835 [Nostoc sp. C052]